MKKNITLLLLTASAAAQTTATPAPSNTVDFKLLREVKDATGNVSLIETKTARPGEQIIQQVTVTVRNAVKSPSLRIPVPENTSYAGDLKLPQGSSALYSVDGKNFSKTPMITVKKGNETTAREAKPSEYRSVKILFPDLSAGQLYTVSYRVTIR